MPGEAEWEGQDDDDWRGFEYGLVEGTVGTVEVDDHIMYETKTAVSHSIFEGSPDTVVYDGEGKLKVELELRMYQHEHC